MQIIPKTNSLLIRLEPNDWIRRQKDRNYNPPAIFYPQIYFTEEFGVEYGHTVQILFAYAIKTIGGQEQQAGTNTYYYTFITGDNLDFYVFPLRPDTEYRFYPRGINSTGIGGSFTRTTLPSTSAYRCSFDPLEPLSFEDKEYNAELARQYFIGAGWSDEAIAAVLGLMYCQSGFNPNEVNIDRTAYLPREGHQINLTTEFSDNDHYIDFNTEYISHSSPYWTYSFENNMYPIYVGNRGEIADTEPYRQFGLLGWKRYQKYRLFDSTPLLDFPANEFWCGEADCKYINYEAIHNWFWDYVGGEEIGLSEALRNITYSNFRTATYEPEEMAHALFYHKQDSLWYDDYQSTLECAMQWARYFYKKRGTHKRHKMPLWEYLRYTV